MKVVIVFLFLFGAAWGQLPRIGCPNIPVQQDFDLDRYMGVWYEDSRSFAAFELTVKCNKAEYTALNSSTVKVVNSGQTYVTGSINSIEGRAVVADREEPAKLKVTFPGSPAGNYWVVSTDYDSYALVYSCSLAKSYVPSYFPLAFENIWILSRERSPLDSRLKDRLYRKLGRYNISPYLIWSSSQSGCRS